MTTRTKLRTLSLLLALIAAPAVAAADAGHRGAGPDAKPGAHAWGKGRGHHGARAGAKAKFDTNKDGKLDAGERARMRVYRVEARFARHDADHDGFLSPTELPGRMSARFAALDVDHDGRISKLEMQSAMAARHAKRMHGKHAGKRMHGKRAGKGWRGKGLERLYRKAMRGKAWRGKALRGQRGRAGFRGGAARLTTSDSDSGSGHVGDLQGGGWIGRGAD